MRQKSCQKLRVVDEIPEAWKRPPAVHPGTNPEDKCTCGKLPIHRLIQIDPEFLNGRKPQSEFRKIHASWRASGISNGSEIGKGYEGEEAEESADAADCVEAAGIAEGSEVANGWEVVEGAEVPESADVTDCVEAAEAEGALEETVESAEVAQDLEAVQVSISAT